MSTELSTFEDVPVAHGWRYLLDARTVSNGHSVQLSLSGKHSLIVDGVPFVAVARRGMDTAEFAELVHATMSTMNVRVYSILKIAGVDALLYEANRDLFGRGVEHPHFISNGHEPISNLLFLHQAMIVNIGAERLVRVEFRELVTASTLTDPRTDEPIPITLRVAVVGSERIRLCYVDINRSEGSGPLANTMTIRDHGTSHDLVHLVANSPADVYIWATTKPPPAWITTLNPGYGVPINGCVVVDGLSIGAKPGQLLRPDEVLYHLISLARTARAPPAMALRLSPNAIMTRVVESFTPLWSVGERPPSGMPNSTLHGGGVLPWVRGRHLNVIEFDIRSMYPTIFLRDHREGAPAIHQALHSLCELRGIADEQGRTTVSALAKMLSNRMIGYLGSTFSRFYNPEMYNAITAAGREALQRMAAAASFGDRGVIVGGSTDSVFVAVRDGVDTRDLVRLTQANMEEIGLEARVAHRFAVMHIYKTNTYAALQVDMRIDDDSCLGLVTRGLAIGKDGHSIAVRRASEQVLRDMLVRPDQSAMAFACKLDQVWTPHNFTRREYEMSDTVLPHRETWKIQATPTILNHDIRVCVVRVPNRMAAVAVEASESAVFTIHEVFYRDQLITLVRQFALGSLAQVVNHESHSTVFSHRPTQSELERFHSCSFSADLDALERDIRYAELQPIAPPVELPPTTREFFQCTLCCGISRVAGPCHVRGCIGNLVCGGV